MGNYDLIPSKTQAIKQFLIHRTHADLANLYNMNMEVQVNVAQDGGSRITGEYKGREYICWTDGIQTWKPLRIPYNASSDPTYEDTNMAYDMDQHAEGIGMTGFDWKERQSRWVAFDFDAITGHSPNHNKKLTDEQLLHIQQVVSAVPWITVRKSTSGRGLHLYVFLVPVATINHTEHAALARAVLGKMSAVTGFDFLSTVDICGGNMWVWHRKMHGTEGLSLIKQGCLLSDIPSNWRDHTSVIKGITQRVRPKYVDNDFEELTGQRPHVELTVDHLRLVTWLEETTKVWWWDQDHRLLVTHTYTLKCAHKALALRGIFDTLATGTEPQDYNCFCFPLRNGAWAIRRFGQGTQEHPSWDQDRSGWTRTYLNKEADLPAAAKFYGGIEHKSGGYVFREAEIAIKATNLLGANLDIPRQISMRRSMIKTLKDGRLLVEIDHDPHDTDMPGWLAEKGCWQRVLKTKTAGPGETEVGNYDDVTRHLVTEFGTDSGWVIKSNDIWREEPMAHVKLALVSLGIRSDESTLILGSSVMKAWTLINLPFQPEYPGDRRWNRNSAQFRYMPSQDKEHLLFPTWKKILEHVGASLTSAVEDNAWCKANGIKSGAEYLKCWLASLFQEPTESLPYLFLYGPQGSGKSIFHEALELLVTRGYVRADTSLVNQSAFNGELENAVICVVEEIDLQHNRQAYNRLKDWVTSRMINIHEKRETPRLVRNTAHFIQCSNDRASCPIFDGDTRIVMAFVDDLDPLTMIPKKQMIIQLQAEAPDFLAELLSVEIPPSNDRLNVPVVVTEDKLVAERANKNSLEVFLEESTFAVAGAMIKYSEFYDRFISWLDPIEAHQWPKIKVGRSLPRKHAKGRNMSDGAQFYVINIAWEDAPPGMELSIKGDRIQ